MTDEDFERFKLDFTDIILQNLNEIKKQSAACVDHHSKLDQLSRSEPIASIASIVWPAIDGMADSAAKVGKTIHPNPSNRRTKEEQKFSKQKGKVISRILLLKDAGKISKEVRKLRNRLEHHDEDLDNWGLANGNDYGAMVSRSIGDTDSLGYIPNGTTIFFHYNIRSMRLLNGSEFYDMRELLKYVLEVSENLDSGISELREFKLQQVFEDILREVK